MSAGARSDARAAALASGARRTTSISSFGRAIRTRTASLPARNSRERAHALREGTGFLHGHVANAFAQRSNGPGFGLRQSVAQRDETLVDLRQRKQNEGAFAQTRMRHGQIRFVDVKFVVEQQIEIDDARSPAFGRGCAPGAAPHPATHQGVRAAAAASAAGPPRWQTTADPFCPRARYDRSTIWRPAFPVRRSPRTRARRSRSVLPGCCRCRYTPGAASARSAQRDGRRRAVENVGLCDRNLRSRDASVLQHCGEQIRGETFEQRIRRARHDPRRSARAARHNPWCGRDRRSPPRRAGRAPRIS